ncbi:hypothetical protein B0I33_112181 [Prauserella shujinwangii]|uniref:Uncharacterized protein n=1 Tax=Prauserella shujinwangii TaxID=1453103 RepID=A0A2T0LMJ8_9PSEU|nr:hypothetical protein [Prauserella shujinwangii]PRX44303.1 hypothetical protein B0I33_112181 [Prauserella shujinwangii]
MTFDLDNAATGFAQEIQDRLDAVLPPSPSADPRLRQLNVLVQGDFRVIRPGTRDKPGGIPLLHNGEHVADLWLTYHCAPDRSRMFLATRKSTFQLSSRQEGTPLLRVDYVHDAHSIPAAHWNVHAERGATSVLLARCNPQHEGLLSRVHLPVGGTRHRPCLEDFLEMLIVEFRIDTLPKWEQEIHAGRERWRTFQTRAIVRDSPREAADVLRRLGYTVTEPAGGPPDRNLEMLRCR